MAGEKNMLIEISAENVDDSSKQYAADIYLPASLYEIDDAIDKCRGYLVKTDIMPFRISECEKVPLLSQWRASHKANIDCASVIKKAKKAEKAFRQQLSF